MLYGGEGASRDGSPTSTPSPVSQQSFSQPRAASGRESAHAGISLWPHVLKARASDGTDVNLLVLDVDDFGANAHSQGRDSCLFALGMLLSSFVTYHTLGGVTETEISDLWAFVAAANKKIEVAPSNDRDVFDTEIDYSDLTPKLL